MAAYVIGHLTVKDPAKWAEYRSKVPATLARWGGEVMLRGQRTAILTGGHQYTDAVVIRFPDAKAIQSWYGSPEYQALISIREAAAEMVLIAYEG